MLTIEQGNRRLLKLADFLDTVPEERFDFNQWGRPNSRGTLGCQSSGCALGWATTMPKFRRLGLKLVINDNEQPLLELTGSNGSNRRGGAECATELFRLTMAQAKYLFIPDCELATQSSWLPGLTEEASPREVANHLRNFVRRRPYTTSVWMAFPDV